MNRAKIAICASSNFKKVKRRENFLLEEENTFQKSLSRVLPRELVSRKREKMHRHGPLEMAFSTEEAVSHAENFREPVPFRLFSHQLPINLRRDGSTCRLSLFPGPRRWLLRLPSLLLLPAQILLEFSAIIKKHSIHATSLVAVANATDLQTTSFVTYGWLGGSREKLLREKRDYTIISIFASCSSVIDASAF